MSDRTLTHNPITLLIMAKAPQPGRAKTRMIPALGAEGSARLARQLLERTLAAATTAGIGQVEVCVTPALASDAWQGMAWPDRVTFSEQGEGTLGQRMARASERLLGRGQSVILMGTDCVQMSPSLLQLAARQLQSADTVIHPTRDGGYALMGLNHFHPSLFRDIPWSTEGVLPLTQQRAQALPRSLILGDLLQDLDEPEDLQHCPELMDQSSSASASRSRS